MIHVANSIKYSDSCGEYGESPEEAGQIATTAHMTHYMRGMDEPGNRLGNTVVPKFPVANISGWFCPHCVPLWVGDTPINACINRCIQSLRIIREYFQAMLGWPMLGDHVGTTSCASNRSKQCLVTSWSCPNWLSLHVSWWVGPWDGQVGAFPQRLSRCGQSVAQAKRRWRCADLAEPWCWLDQWLVIQLKHGWINHLIVELINKLVINSMMINSSIIIVELMIND